MQNTRVSFTLKGSVVAADKLNSLLKASSATANSGSGLPFALETIRQSELVVQTTLSLRGRHRCGAVRLHRCSCILSIAAGWHQDHGVEVLFQFEPGHEDGSLVVRPKPR